LVLKSLEPSGQLEVTLEVRVKLCSISAATFDPDREREMRDSADDPAPR
jgi:hypothetical protein